MATPPDKAKPPLRNPNIDTTTPEKEKGVSNPRRDRELERPEGPGETGPEMIPPGRVRTGQGGRDDDAGKGGGLDDDEAPEGDDEPELPATDQETGRRPEPTRNPTRGGDNAGRGTTATRR